ncbi:MAG: serine/threonine-protein kinase [Myxococcaceae bacterium]
MSQGSDDSITLPQSSPPSPRRTSDEPLKPGRVVDRYVVLHRVGKGGMGVVYAAYDPQLDRKVAIKILRPDVPSDAPRQRLLREAQAMARVSHPNVIRVYDVGTVDDVVFMAMELVEGEALNELLLRTQPSWRDCLRLFVAAGRGLAAAHGAGLVHRDFKPGNVLVGNDGGVRVIDFGVARASTVARRDLEVPTAARDPDSSGALDSPLTRDGALVGTPHYMAPEQLAGQLADAHSDQFAFCVALFQSLYGIRPFPADTFEGLKVAIAANRVAEPPAGSKVPARVRRALVRGLRAAPAERWPSMEALLTELDRDPTGRFKRTIGIALTAGAAVVAIAGWQVSQERARSACARAGASIGEHWNDEKKAQLHQAFTATGMPFAEASWATAASRLDAYTAEWKAMRTEACAVTRLEHAQTEDQLALRVSCLDQRQQELAALVLLLSRPDAQVVQGAVEAAHALTSLSGCSDLVALKGRRPPPRDLPALMAIDRARGELAAVKSLADSGQIAPALTRAHTAAELARAAGFAPLIAEALVRQGELQTRAGERKQAEQTLQESVWFAQVGGDDELAARGWNALAYLVGVELGRGVEGQAFGNYAAAVIARDGDDPELRAENLLDTGLMLQKEGKFEEALKVLKESLSLREKVFGPEHPAVAAAMSKVGNTYILAGQFSDARQFQERALAIRSKLLGAQHPDTSASYHNVAICLSHLGEREKAIGYLQQALDADTAVFGPHSDHTAQTRQTLAKAWFQNHQNDRARAAAEQSLADLTAAFGSDAPDLCPTLLLLGRIAFAEGRYPEALAFFSKGLAIREKQMGADKPIFGGYLTGVGKTQLALHQPRLALAAFTRARAIGNGANEAFEDRAEIAFGLAQATWDGGGDKSAAADLALEAATLYRSAKDHDDDVARVEAWLKTHKR